MLIIWLASNTLSARVHSCFQPLRTANPIQLKLQLKIKKIKNTWYIEPFTSWSWDLIIKNFANIFDRSFPIEWRENCDILEWW
jgi:hypothetical protein